MDSIVHPLNEPTDKSVSAGDKLIGYRRMHAERIAKTIGLLREYRCRRVLELGSHPWVMTTALLDEGSFDVVATVSAEEAMTWPDDPAVKVTHHVIDSPSGARATIKNYSFNVERRLALIDERVDVVLACEIIEHLIRSPHVMLMNANRWLGVGGRIVITTPNGSQFMNPLKRAPRMPAYRARCYERHAYVYRLRDLLDLVQLCGFDVEQAGFWSPYPASGTARLRALLARIPGSYFAEKFHRTIFVIARKEREVNVLDRTPRVYVPSPYWEHIEDRSRRACQPTASGGLPATALRDDPDHGAAT